MGEVACFSSVITIKFTIIRRSEAFPLSPITFFLLQLFLPFRENDNFQIDKLACRMDVSQGGSTVDDIRFP
jgi:hypothetical protein